MRRSTTNEECQPPLVDTKCVQRRSPRPETEAPHHVKPYRDMGRGLGSEHCVMRTNTSALSPPGEVEQSDARAGGRVFRSDGVHVGDGPFDSCTSWDLEQTHTQMASWSTSGTQGGPSVNVRLCQKQVRWCAGRRAWLVVPCVWRWYSPCSCVCIPCRRFARAPGRLRGTRVGHGELNDMGRPRTGARVVLEMLSESPSMRSILRTNPLFLGHDLKRPLAGVASGLGPLGARAWLLRFQPFNCRLVDAWTGVCEEAETTVRPGLERWGRECEGMQRV